MKIVAVHLFVVLLFLAVSACANDFRDKFVGEWKA